MPLVSISDPLGICASRLCGSKHWSEGKYFQQSHCKSPHTKAQLLWDLVLLFWDKQSPFGQGKGTWLSGGGRAVVLRWSVEFGTLCSVTLFWVFYWLFMGTSFSTFCGMWTWERPDGHLTGSVRISGPAESLPQDRRESRMTYKEEVVTISFGLETSGGGSSLSYNTLLPLESFSRKWN